jgi:triosephosphate isomerase
MLKESGAEWVIVGHSERRRDQGETDELVGHKVRAAVNNGLSPIVCVGESLRERKDGKALSTVEAQIRAIHHVAVEHLAQAVIAYEPIWAIGTGEAATPEQAEEVHAHIASVLRDLSLDLPVLYGGSVKGSNAAELFSQPHISGALVGGAALAAEDFCAIVAAAEERA